MSGRRAALAMDGVRDRQVMPAVRAMRAVPGLPAIRAGLGALALLLAGCSGSAPALQAAAPAVAPAASVAPRAPAAPAAFAPFSFVALGDMPYGTDALAGQAYRQLIDRINALQPAFSLHVGDFKAGMAECSDAEYALQFDNFQRFAQALVYTPGDNDWLDCQRRGDDPLARLQALRQRFFAAPQSLGRQPLALLRQADAMPAFARFVENLRWVHQGVVFATVHTVGPDNGAGPNRSAALHTESAGREAANAAWIAAAFAEAGRLGARALVLATQADMLEYTDRSRPDLATLREGFGTSIGATLLPLAAAAPFPVLLVHGDSHQFIVDQPFRDAGGRPIANLWRLEVFGAPRLHALQVQIGVPDGAMPFTIRPVWNPLSSDPRTGRQTAP